jgi:hypothetical protein
MAEYVGIVEDAMFRPLGRGGSVAAVKLTADGMQVARPVQPMDVADYEGLAVLAEGGPLDGEWLYGAEVLDQAGPRLSFALKRILSQRAEGQS